MCMAAHRFWGLDDSVDVSVITGALCLEAEFARGFLLRVKLVTFAVVAEDEDDDAEDISPDKGEGDLSDTAFGRSSVLDFENLKVRSLTPSFLLLPLFTSTVLHCFFCKEEEEEDTAAPGDVADGGDGLD